MRWRLRSTAWSPDPPAAPCCDARTRWAMRRRSAAAALLSHGPQLLQVRAALARAGTLVGAAGGGAASPCCLRHDLHAVDSPVPVAACGSAPAARHACKSGHGRKRAGHTAACRGSQTLALAAGDDLNDFMMASPEGGALRGARPDGALLPPQLAPAVEVAPSDLGVNMQCSGPRPSSPDRSPSRPPLWPRGAWLRRAQPRGPPTLIGCAAEATEEEDGSRAAAAGLGPFAGGPKATGVHGLLGRLRPSPHPARRTRAAAPGWEASGASMQGGPAARASAHGPAPPKRGVASSWLRPSPHALRPSRIAPVDAPGSPVLARRSHSWGEAAARGPSPGPRPAPEQALPNAWAAPAREGAAAPGRGRGAGPAEQGRGRDRRGGSAGGGKPSPKRGTLDVLHIARLAGAMAGPP